jgi:hypothetical protein
MLDFVWDFLRDEQNREALKIIGATLTALGVAGWAVFRELRTARQIAEITAELERLRAEHLALANKYEGLRASEADILRGLARAEQRHDLLFGVMVGRGVTAMTTAEDDEPPAKT